MPRKTTKPAPAAPAHQMGGAPATMKATPAPADDEGDRDALFAGMTGSRHRAHNACLLSDVASVSGLPADHPHRAQREAALLGAMRGVGAQDTVEGLMAANVAALSHTALACLRLAANAGDVERASRLRRDAFAAIRTMNESVAALNTKRSGGVVQQRVVVERVLVQEGAALAIGAGVGEPTRGR